MLVYSEFQARRSGNTRLWTADDSAEMAIRHPIPALFICFLAGLCLAIASEIRFEHALVLPSAMLLIYLCACIPGRRRNVFRIAMLSAAFFGFAADAARPAPSFRPPWIAMKKDLVFEGRLFKPPEVRGDRTRLYLELETVFYGRARLEAAGRVALNVEGKWRKWRSGDRVRTMSKLSRPLPAMNPGNFDRKEFLERRGVSLVGSTEAERVATIVIDGEKTGLFDSLMRYRDTVSDFIDARIPEEEAGVLKALTLGKGEEVGEEERLSFSRSGTAHLLAVSGLHIGIFALGFYGVLRFLLLRSRRLASSMNVPAVAAALSLPVAPLFAVFAGFSPSAERAAVMCCVHLLSIAVLRPCGGLDTLCISAFISLVREPSAISETSFQLSYCSVLFLLLFARHVEAILRGGGKTKGLAGGCRRFFSSSLSASIAGLLGSAPLVARYFHLFTPIALAANMALIPLCACLIVPLGLTASVLLPAGSEPAGFLFWACGRLASLSIMLSSLFASVPGGWFKVPEPDNLTIALYYAAVAGLILAIRGSVSRTAAAAPAVMLMFLLSVHLFRVAFDRRLDVTFLYAGQGDSAFVRFPEGKTMLIDTGGSTKKPDAAVKLLVAPFLTAGGFNRLDFLVISHNHVDHAGGAAFIAENFRPAPTVLDIGALPEAIDGVRISAIKPCCGFQENDSSLVLKLSFGSVSFLFPGDVEKDAERFLLESTLDLKADVLKVPHHGSRRSSSDEFLDAVRPSFAVVSAGGNNPFGLPHRATIERYEKRGFKLLRTDVDGAVTFSTDGTKIEVRTFIEK